MKRRWVIEADISESFVEFTFKRREGLAKGVFSMPEEFSPSCTLRRATGDLLTFTFNFDAGPAIATVDRD